MTICPPIAANNTKQQVRTADKSNSYSMSGTHYQLKTFLIRQLFRLLQYDSTKSPLDLLEQTCRSIGADTSSNSKSSSLSIDHTKKSHTNGSHSLNKLHLNGYKPSSLAINQLASLAGHGYETGRRSGNSSAEYDRGSVSPASVNLATNGSRPNSNNGNSRPNSNNSGNSSLTSAKGKDMSKLSFKPYDEQRNNDKSSQRKHHSPELEHLKSIAKSDRKLDALNGLSPKNSANSSLANLKANASASSANLSYAQQQQLIEQKLVEFHYQQYLASLAASYQFNGPSSLLAAAAALQNPMLSRSSNAAHQLNANQNTSTTSQQPTQPVQQTSATSHPSVLPPPSMANCPPGCDSCIIHNPLLSSFATATQTPSSVSSSNSNTPFSAHHLAALSQQYPQIPPQFFHLYGLAGYPSLSGLAPPPVTSNAASSSSNSSATASINHHAPATNQTLNSLNQLQQLNSSASSNHNPLAMPHHPLTSSSHNSSSSSNKSAPHFCTFMNPTGSYCGKRFNTMDEYLIHLKSHPTNDFHNSSLNPASLESLYGSYEAMLAGNPAALANLKRSAMHDSLSSSRFHPYGKPAATNNYSQSNSSLSSAAMLPPSNMPFPLGALSGLNGLNNLSGLNLPTNSNSAAAAAAFNSMYAGYGGRLGPTVQP